jgi:hypothetical protein
MNEDVFVDTVERLLQLMCTSSDPRLKPAKGGWSIIEVAGHLVDSATNNIQRLQRYQAGGELTFPGYDQETFVQRAAYRDFDFNSLLSMWYNLNKLLLHIYMHIPPEDRKSLVKIGEKPAVTIDQLLNGYLTHMENHEQQIEAIINAQIH